MIILKGFKTCVVIDNREEEPSPHYKNEVVLSFLNKLVYGDLICKVEIYNQLKLTETIHNDIEGGLIDIDSLKHLKIN